jgi:hypothetical protein
MRILIVFLLSFIFKITASASSTLPPDTLTWATLVNLQYKTAAHAEYGMVDLPIFNKEVQRLANKRVAIRGYLVPVDKTTWALSKNTYAACFFCGKAGPETVMGLKFKVDPGRLKMDANVIIVGKFVLNGDNVEDWMYSLQDAEIVYTK